MPPQVAAGAGGGNGEVDHLGREDKRPQNPHQRELAFVHFLFELPGAVDGEPGGGGPHRPAHCGGNQGIRHVHRHISIRCSLGALPPASERPDRLVRRNFPGDRCWRKRRKKSRELPGAFKRLCLRGFLNVLLRIASRSSSPDYGVSTPDEAVCQAYCRKPMIPEAGEDYPPG